MLIRRAGARYICRFCMAPRALSLVGLAAVAAVVQSYIPPEGPDLRTAHIVVAGQFPGTHGQSLITPSRIHRVGWCSSIYENIELSRADHKAMWACLPARCELR